ncbi:MAG TPA: hypothetical protein VMJ33_10625 [Gallionella sp.]|nr:hypothetical protein [Gallionella sp.]
MEAGSAPKLTLTTQSSKHAAINCSAIHRFIHIRFKYYELPKYLIDGHPRSISGISLCRMRQIKQAGSALLCHILSIQVGLGHVVAFVQFARYSGYDMAVAGVQIIGTPFCFRIDD